LSFLLAQTNPDFSGLNRHRGSTPDCIRQFYRGFSRRDSFGGNPSLSASYQRQVCKYLSFLLAQTNPDFSGLNRHRGSTPDCIRQFYRGYSRRDSFGGIPPSPPDIKGKYANTCLFYWLGTNPMTKNY